MFISQRMVLLREVAMSILRFLFLLAAGCFLYACKIDIIVPEGARVYTNSGSYSCESGQTCSIEVVDVFFSETFRVEAPDGLKLSAWRQRDLYLCGGQRAACKVSTGIFAGTEFEQYIADDFTFFLEPVFGKANQWLSLAETATAGVGASSCVMNGKLYVFGLGWATTDSPNAVEEYNPETGEWRRRRNMPTPRAWQSATTVGQLCYVIGGGTLETGLRADALTTLEAYNPRKNSWISLAPLPAGRSGAAAVSVGSKIYLIGGGDIIAWDATPRAAVAIYDTRTDKWSRGAAMPHPMGGVAAAAIDGLIYVVGGGNPQQGIHASDLVQRYDPQQDQWTVVNSMPMARNWMAASALNGKIYAMGGLVGSGDSTSNVVMRYNPAVDNWTTVAPLPTGRYAPAAATLNGKLLVVGGRSLRESAPLGVTEEYTPR